MRCDRQMIDMTGQFILIIRITATSQQKCRPVNQVKMTFNIYSPIHTTRVVMDTKWRIIPLLLMGFSFVMTLVATITTNWREDEESRYDVFITHGLWRICRDIKFGSTFDHKCHAEYASNGPDWLIATRVFMTLSCLTSFLGFVYSVYLMATIPKIQKFMPYPCTEVSLNWSGLIFLISAICAFIGAIAYSAATSMEQALYFPENLPPTWGNSWAQVLARRNSMPSDLPNTVNMTIEYGYSFGLAWFGVVLQCCAFVINFFVSAQDLYRQI